MSWDVTIEALPAGLARRDELPAAETVPPLGERARLAPRMLVALPGATFAGPRWGLFEGVGFTLEIDLGAGDETAMIGLTVDGHGTGAADAIAALLRELPGARAVDVATGTIFDAGQVAGALAASRAPSGPAAAWAAFRDGVAGDGP